MELLQPEGVSIIVNGLPEETFGDAELLSLFQRCAAQPGPSGTAALRLAVATAVRCAWRAPVNVPHRRR
jgi:hypothetical protein